MLVLLEMIMFILDLQQRVKGIYGVIFSEKNVIEIK